MTRQLARVDPPSRRIMLCSLEEKQQGRSNPRKPRSSRGYPALLSQSAIVVARQLEPLNVFLGWEEANKYQLLSPEGHLLGYLLEEESSLVGTMSRQLLKTHRPFRATVISPDGEVLLRVQRPFSWINSRIYISTPSGAASTAQDAKNEMQRIEQSGTNPTSTALTTHDPATPPPPPDTGEIIGETQQEWHWYRRRYNHFVRRGDEMVQFARTDSGFLAWDFFVRDESNQVIGSINRNFAGFGRELFTDTGQYVLRFEGVIDELNPQLEGPKPAGALPEPSAGSTSSPLSRGLLREPAETSTAVTARTEDSPITPPSLPLDHRAVLLATAITTDIDYFSRSRGGLLGGGGMFMPMPIPMGGFGGGGGGAGAEEAGGGVGAMGGAASEGPLPSTEYEEDEFAARAREARSSEEGEGSMPPGPSADRGDGGLEGGGGGGSDWYGGAAEREELLEDPWASETPEEGGTWSWGDLFDQDGGGGGDGGGDGDGW
ncbi:hypothetical protein B0A53_00232 [Rhodotorula sp. CCFEE 5036]|nr:hypothetical protein B0A53_00232 [Rhodotorula sp. CCFEE 5036]